MAHTYVGKICPYCKTTFQEDDTIAICGSCFMPHHLACWQANEGCTTYGCKGVIESIINSENANKTSVLSKQETVNESKPPGETGKFETIFESLEGKLQEDVPVLIQKVTLIKNNDDGSIFARCVFRSLTDDSIKALLLDIIATDAWGNPAEGVEGFQLLDLKTKRESEFGQTTPIPIPNKNVRSIEIVIKKILYEDRRMEDCNEAYSNVPDQPTLLSVLELKECVEQYAGKTTKEAKFVPVVGDKVWRCTCGAVNSNNDENCYKCSTKLSLQQAYFRPEEIIEKTKAYLEEKRRKEEEIRLERQKQQREAEERLRKAQEEKERQDREAIEAKKAKKRKRIKKTIITIVTVILLAVLSYGTIFHLVPLLRYNNAASNVEKHEYEAAYNTYIALGDYKDCSTKATETIYAKAQYFESQEQYTEAAVEYERIPEYQDSKTKAVECKNEASYISGKEKFEAKAFDEAIKIFTALGEYKDSKDWIDKTNYAYAKACLEKEDYAKAYELFTSLKDYEDSKDQAKESQYLAGQKAFDAKEYDKAFEYFNAIDKSYKDSEEKAKESKYLVAINALTQKQYKDASDAFNDSVLKDYKDSADKCVEASYLYAKSCYDSKNYNDAVTYFGRSKGYEDTDELVVDAKYENALIDISKKDYKKAVSALESIGNYKDSKTKINEAKYAYVTANKNSTDTTTYNYLKDLKKAGYSDSSKIYNSLYAWKVTITAVNNSSSSSSNMSSISKYDNIYFHYKVSGGPPGESLKLKFVGKLPGCSAYTGIDTVRSGSTGSWYLYFTYGYRGGTATGKYYDSNGNLLDSASVSLY